MNSDAEGIEPVGREDALRAAVDFLLSFNDRADPRVGMLAQVTMQVLMEEDGDAE
ncbi:MAG: hypothetical protein ACOY7P_12530 [Pseudomonadota bacterium]